MNKQGQGIFRLDKTVPIIRTVNFNLTFEKFIPKFSRNRTILLLHFGMLVASLSVISPIVSIYMYKLTATVKFIYYQFMNMTISLHWHPAEENP